MFQRLPLSLPLCLVSFVTTMGCDDDGASLPEPAPAVAPGSKNTPTALTTVTCTNLLVKAPRVDLLVEGAIVASARKGDFLRRAQKDAKNGRYAVEIHDGRGTNLEATVDAAAVGDTCGGPAKEALSISRNARFAETLQSGGTLGTPGCTLEAGSVLAYESVALEPFGNDPILRVTFAAAAKPCTFRKGFLKAANARWELLRDPKSKAQERQATPLKITHVEKAARRIPAMEIRLAPKACSIHGDRVLVGGAQLFSSSEQGARIQAVLDLRQEGICDSVAEKCTVHEGKVWVAGSVYAVETTDFEAAALLEEFRQKGLCDAAPMECSMENGRILMDGGHAWAEEDAPSRYAKFLEWKEEGLCTWTAEECVVKGNEIFVGGVAAYSTTSESDRFEKLLSFHRAGLCK